MKFLIPMVVGGVIGYFTNWLAIKMLFRPYEEKRIFGIKVPFTPGLIPKERYRVSKSVGNAVGEYLLTPDKIMETLESDETKLSVRKWLRLKNDELKDSEKSVGDILNSIDTIRDNNYKYKLEEKLLLIIFNKINTKDFQLSMLTNIEEYYEKISLDLIDKIRNNGSNIIDLYLKDENNKKFVVNYLEEIVEEIGRDNRTIEDVLPKELLEFIGNKIESNEDDIVKFIKNLLNDPILQLKIKNSIEETVNKNVSRMITTFISTETITEKIYSIGKEYIESEKADKLILTGIDSLLEKALEMNIASFKAIIYRIIDKEDLDIYYDKILDFINTDKRRSSLINKSCIILNSKSKEYKSTIVTYVYNEIKDFLGSEKLYFFIQETVKENTSKLLDIKVRDISKKLGEKDLDNLSNVIQDILNGLEKDKIVEFIGMFNIAKIVEEQINSFDVEFGEELILEIAGKELKAITSLGAVLGGFLGLLSPLLQML